MNYKRQTLLLILIATIIRSIVAGTIGLGNDEVYYRMYAQYLQWNYFDHPPMVAWLIRCTTANLLLHQEFFIRLGAIISAAVTTWILFLCGKKLNNGYTGFLAAALYTATIYGSIVAGIFILPDSPQMVCWAAGLYLLIDIISINAINKISKKKLIYFGVVMGLGMLCKIHTSFLWLGFLLYIIFYNRKWLQEATLYLSGIITIVFFYPVIQWNINNHFVTYLYHSQRVSIGDSSFNFDSFITFFAGQIFYFNPIIFILLIIVIIKTLKNKFFIDAAQKKLLLLCSLPLIIITTAVSLFKEVLPHWAGPAYTALILLTAYYFSAKEKKYFQKNILPKPILAATILIAAIITAGVLLINFYPGTLGKKDKIFLGEGDFTLDMYGWNSFKKDFKKILDADLQSGNMKTDAVIICNKWFPAAHIDNYVAIPLQKNVIAIGDTNEIHQYAWINAKRKMLQAGDDAYCIVPSNYYADVKEIYAPYFATILPPQIIEQKRSGVVCRSFYIWRLKNFRAK